MKKKFMVYTILCDGRPVYVGRGRTAYREGRKGWSRIDVHKNDLARVMALRGKGQPLPPETKFELYRQLAEMINSGGTIGYSVLLETDSPYDAITAEEAAITACLIQNPGLLNIRDLSGNIQGEVGPRKNRAPRKPMSDEHRQAIADRMTGKPRGKYNVTPEGLAGLQAGASNNPYKFQKKLTGLTPEQVKARGDERAKINRQIRLARKSGSDVTPLIEQLNAIDIRYGLDPDYKPRSYGHRAVAHLSLDQEKAFCTTFIGRSFTIKIFQQEFKEQFGKPISVSGAYAMMARNNLVGRHLGSPPSGWMHGGSNPVDKHQVFPDPGAAMAEFMHNTLLPRKRAEAEFLSKVILGYKGESHIDKDLAEIPKNKSIHAFGCK